LESGAAVNTSGTIWQYTASQNNENLRGDKIVITASDLPGNVTAEEREL
jgi:hypothetical protein